MRSYKINKLLNNLFHDRKNSVLPSIVCILDDLKAYKQYIANLPKHNSLVLVRDYKSRRRKYFTKIIAQLCRQKGIKILIAGDPELARSVNADGLHISEGDFFRLRVWKYKMPKWIITTSAHTVKRLFIARHYQMDAVFYSSVFFTNSHPDRKPLGILRFMRDTNILGLPPIYALGGITGQNLNKLLYSNIIGIAGIRIFRSK